MIILIGSAIRFTLTGCAPLRSAILPEAEQRANISRPTSAISCCRSSPPFDMLHVTSSSMSVRFVFRGGLQAPAAGLLANAPRIPAQQLSGFHSSVRPSSVTSRLPSQSQTNASLPGLRPSGLRMNSTSAPAKDDAKLDWNSFFKLRASRRRYSLVSSIASSVVSTTAGVQILSAQDLESLGAQVMGLDPFIVLGLATAACGAVGWLAGPVFGNGLWGLVYRRLTPSFATVSTQMMHQLHQALIHGFLERERILRSDSAIPRRPFNKLDLEPSS